MVAAALVGAWAAPATAAAQEDDRSVLLILDASKSMNEPAGDGGTRLDAAKAALRELIPALPPDARVGLRVYGSEVSEAGRAEGCRDTKLVVPVGPLDAGALRAQVDPLEGRGRTPIGRSLLAAAGDLPPGGERTVVLVSDGGDNCAPPPPCRAARRVSRRGVRLSISVVGLQVNERVRRQLRCIAEAGGGSYVDAGDPEALRDELLAAISRAFRSYEPDGTPVDGAPSLDQAPELRDGQYLDEIAPGEQKHFAVRVEPAQRLYASVALPLPRGLDGTAGLNVKLISPDGEEVVDDNGGIDYDSLGQYGNIEVRGLRSAQTAAPGVESDVPPGVWRIAVTLESGDLEPRPIPVELAIQTLDPDEPPGLVREPGPAPGPPPPPDGGPVPSPTATPSATAIPADDDGGGGAAAALVAAGGGLVAGLLGGFAAARRRRR